MDRDKIRCPCKKCKNKAFKGVDTVRLHLASKGFELNYHVWVFQGERPPNVRAQRPNLTGSSSASMQYRQMVVDAASSRFNLDYHMDDVMETMEELPNPEAQRFYDMLRAADNELWPGCRNHSQLSLVARMMNLKYENSISEKCFDEIAELMKEIVPDENLVPENFYKTKRLLSGMGLPVQKIDCCYHNCTPYWTKCSDLELCSICSYLHYETRGRKRIAKKRMYYFPLTGTTYSSDESDYFGRLLEVLQVEYPGIPIKKTTFFKCEWFDGSSVGTHVSRWGWPSGGVVPGDYKGHRFEYSRPQKP